jgi:hypothetical protein
MIYAGIDAARTSIFVARLGLLPGLTFTCRAILAFPRWAIYSALLLFCRLHKCGVVVIPRRRRTRLHCAGSDGLETPVGDRNSVVVEVRSLLRVRTVSHMCEFPPAKDMRQGKQIVVCVPLHAVKRIID